MCAALIATSIHAFAGEPLKLEDITKGAFAAKTISGINPLKGTSDYAQISADRKKILLLRVKKQACFSTSTSSTMESYCR